MSLKRADYTDPANAPFGKRQVKYPTPNRQDLVVIENVPIAPDKYEPLPYHSPHPDYENNGLILVWQGPVKAANNQVKVLRVYANDEGNEDWYNFSVHYSGDVSTAPIHVRSYVVLREDYVADTRGQPLKKIIRLRVTAEGTGLTKASTATISGGGGSGGACTPIIAGGKLIGLELTDAGDSYETNPTIAFGGPGTGATAVAEIQPQTMLLVKEDTAKLDAEDPQLASLFIKVTKVYETLPGPWQYTDSYVEERGTVQRATRPILATGSEEGSFERSGLGPILATKTSYEPRGESAIVLIEIVETWIEVSRDDQVVTSEFGGGILDETERRGEPGSLVPETGFLVESSSNKTISPHEVVQTTRKLSGTTPVLKLTQQGTGYLTPPLVSFVDGVGSGAEATAQLGFSVVSISVDDGGSDYSSPPLVHLNGDGYGVVARAILNFGLADILITNPGSGYTSNPTLVVTGGGGSGATGTVARSFAVASVTITNPGSLYTSDPEVTYAGGGGRNALFRAVRGLPLLSIEMDEEGAGAGYTSAPTVGITGGSGSGAAGTAILGKTIESISISSPGTGYSSAPTVEISGGNPDSIALASAELLGYEVDSLVVTALGTGYSSLPSVHLTGDGAGATANARLGAISAAIAAGGTGYAVNDILTVTGGTSTTAVQLRVTAETGGVITAASIETVGVYSVLPSNPISVTGGTGTGATFNLTWGVSALVLAAPGSGYGSVPSIVITGGGGTGATGISILSATQGMRITLINGGSGFESAPTITLTGGGGTGATATATLASTASIKRVDLSAVGSGYRTAPVIAFSGGAGNGAEATAVLDTDAAATISQIVVVNGGEGFTSAPTLAITGGGGSAAAATAVLATAGSIASITITNEGDGFDDTPVISFTGGGGSEAEARGVLSAFGEVASVELELGGSNFTEVPAVEFLGGGGSGAEATAELAETGSVIGLFDIELGSYTEAPTVVFTSDDGSGAEATYTLETGWPPLYGVDTDPREGIVVNIEKTVVPANSPSLGGFVDISPLDKWRSIQIVSAIDLHSLPPPEVFFSTQRIRFPDALVSVGPLWDAASSVSNSTSKNRREANNRVSVSVSGAIVVTKKGGFQGAAIARVERQFFFGAPPDSLVPLPTIIRPSSGTAVLVGHSSTQSNGGSNIPRPLNFAGQPAKLGDIMPGSTVANPIILAGIIIPPVKTSSSTTTTQSTHVADISDVLTAGFSSTKRYDQESTSGTGPTRVQAGTAGDFSVDIPPSCPAYIQEGASILAEVSVEKWRLGLYARTLIYVIAPGDCEANGGGAST